MKILITTDWYRPVINGVVTSVVNLSDGLTALGHEVRILTLSGDRHSRKSGNVTWLGSIGVGMIYPNARLKTAPGSRFVREIIDWRPDVVHSQCEFSTFFLAKKISEACGCPLVHTYHTVYEDFTHYFSPSVRLGRVMASVFTRAIVARTDTVVAPTEKVREMLQRYGVQTPIAVIPTGLKLGQFEPPVPAQARNALRTSLGICPDDRVLLFLGRMAQEKNIDQLLHLVHRQPDSRVRLVLVGDGPYRAALEEAVQALHLESRVTFTGMVPPSAVAAYYAMGDIFVSASQSETQGLTYLEAMAGGLPLLCRDDPCLRDVVDPGVTGFTYQNEAEFDARVQSLLSDDEARCAMGRAARETVFRRFSAAVFATQIQSVYQTLLERISVSGAA